MAQSSALIIDDNPKNLLVLEQLLRMENVQTYRISATANLSAALDSIPAVDVVFLDLEMPDTNGYEALEILKGHPNFQHAKMIAYTVHVSEINTTMAMGFDGFLGKPLSAEAFPQQLEHILRGEEVRYIP